MGFYRRVMIPKHFSCLVGTCKQEENHTRSIIISFIIVYLIFIASSGSGKVIINEVELNPPGDDMDNEWVELYNAGDVEVDVSGWKLLTVHGSRVCIKIPPISIPPHSFCVVGSPGQWLDNEMEVIVLQNETGFEIDRTPCLGDEEDGYCAWSRFPDGEDTDTNFEWGFMNSTMWGWASGDICYPRGAVYFHISGAMEGDISSIEVTPNGRLAAPPQSYYANIDDRGNKLLERTTALEGHYSSDEVIYNGGSTVLYPEPGVTKPEMCEYYYGVYGSKSIDYAGEGLNDREYLGREQSYYSGTEFLYNKAFSKDRLGTSLEAHTSGIADLEYRQIDFRGNLSEEYVDRYVGEFDIERHIKMRYLNESYRFYDRFYYGDDCRPGIILYHSDFVDVERLETCDSWLACCLNTTGQLVGSKESKVYHYLWCASVEEINSGSLIWFSSPNEAVSQGYSPCEICKPPLKESLWVGRYAKCMNSTS